MNQGQLNELTKRLDTLIERTDPMKDEMYVAFRSYLEEQSQLLRQILEEVKGQKVAATPLERYVSPEASTFKSPAAPKVPAEAVGNVTMETTQPSGATTVQTLDSGKDDKAATGKPKASTKPSSAWGS